MKSNKPLIDSGSLERDLEMLAPMIRAGLNYFEGPSDNVLEAIHKEAAARAFTAERRRVFSVRFWAVAASVLILMGGALQYYQSHQAGVQAKTLQLVLHIGAPHAVNGSGPVGGTAELANRLLNIQGLDEETFFTSDETEVLSL